MKTDDTKNGTPGERIHEEDTNGTKCLLLRTPIGRAVPPHHLTMLPGPGEGNPQSEIRNPQSNALALRIPRARERGRDPEGRGIFSRGSGDSS